MAENKDNLREWSERLEAGARDDELLAVAARLESAAKDEPSAPSVEFRRQLRRDLLNQYATASNRPVKRLWRWAGSLAAVGLLAALVITTWLSMSSAGRETAGGVALTAVATATPLPSGYALVDYSVSGGIVIETTEPDNPQKTSIRLVPGLVAEIVTRWSVSADAGEAPIFSLHLLDGEGRLLSQGDARLQPSPDQAAQTAEAILMLDIPADLAPGTYEIDGGLFDAATGARLSFTMPEGEASLIHSEFVIPAEAAAGTEQLTETASNYRLLDYSTNGGVVTETVETDDPANPAVTHLLVPGMTMTVTLGWSLPPEAAIVSAFVHLLDDDGQIVAQADAPVMAATGAADRPFEATLALNLPADLPAGEYEVVAGLYEPGTGARLSFTTADGEVMNLIRTDFVVSDRNANSEQMNETVIELQDENHSLIPLHPTTEAGHSVVSVIDIEPAAGTVVSGTAPIHFRITLSYSLDSLSSAFLEVRVAELTAGGGRQLGKATADLSVRNGTLELEIVIDPASALYGLNGPGDLGLEFEVRPNPTGEAIPFVVETPGDVRWRYEP